MSVAAMTLDEKLAAREMLKQQVADLKRKVADLDQQLADQERAAWERALLISARFCVGVKRTSDHSDVRAAAGSRRVSARRCLLWRWLRDMASVLFLGRRRRKTATSNLGDLGDAAKTDRTCATGAPHCVPLRPFICVPSGGSVVGIEMGKPRRRGWRH